MKQELIQAPVAQGERGASQGEILIVEDTPASLKLLSDLLTQAGYFVRQAPNGELALWTAQTRPPELILLDVRMPGIDGFEVCRRLKQSPQLREIPVIFLSAQYETDDKVQGFQAGGIDFIAKPYQAEEVLARTDSHIRLARTQRALSQANADLTSTLEQLASARDEIARSERLAALGALVAGVAHELNTPIGNSVLAASTLLERTREFALGLGKGMRRSDLEQYVASALQASDLLLRNLERSAKLIGSFKQVAVDQSNSPRHRFDLAEALAGMSVTIDPAAVAVRTEVAGAIEVDSFPDALNQIFMHLVLNASLHGFDAGGVGQVVVSAALAPNDDVMLNFVNNGAGIAAHHVERIFDPFFTTKFGQGSGGLGLNIVHNLVTNVLGGSIAVASEPGLTQFMLRFPRCAPQLGSPAGSPAGRRGAVA